nr:reverse transcriptase domain-containing protein [Tanacetum cinerariifolium]
IVALKAEMAKIVALKVKAVTPNCETCGGPHSFNDCPATVGNTQNGPTIPTTSSLPPVVERETEATKDTVHPTNNGSTKDVQPLVVKTESPILNSEPVVVSLIEPVVAPVKVCSAITDDGMGVSNLAKRFFKNLKTTRASLVGSAFASTHFDK